MMHMTFWWGSNVGDIFIKGITVNSAGSLVILCLILVTLSILFEGLKVRYSKGFLNGFVIYFSSPRYTTLK